MTKKQSTSSLISSMKRKTRKLFSSEEKIRIIIDGMRGEYTVSELCRKEATGLKFSLNSITGLGCIANTSSLAMKL